MLSIMQYRSIQKFRLGAVELIQDIDNFGVCSEAHISRDIFFRTSGSLTLASPVLRFFHNLNNLCNFAYTNSPIVGGFPLPWFYLKKVILTFQVPNLNEIVSLIKPVGLFVFVLFRRNISPLQCLLTALQIYKIILKKAAENQNYFNFFVKNSPPPDFFFSVIPDTQKYLYNSCAYGL